MKQTIPNTIHRALLRFKPVSPLFPIALFVAFALACESGKTPTSTASKSVAPTAADLEAASTRCELITRSILEAGFPVTITCDDTHAYLASSTYPTHDVMTGIVGSNEQTAVPAANYVSPLRLNPTKAKKFTSIDAAVGVAVNGVPIYDYTAQGDLDPAVYDVRGDTVVTGQLDICNGHAGRGDDYHYHASPKCMIDAMPNKDDNPIIGWGFDGYPLYGHKAPDGTAIEKGTLGVCNEVQDDTYGWRYHTSTYPPYIIQCLVGEVNERILPRVPPLRGVAGGDRRSGTPPRGGVENLVMTQTGDKRVMTYSYKGSDYFINYEPADEKDCYSIEWNTVSTGSDSGTFCR